jgi:hypothetical protein
MGMSWGAVAYSLTVPMEDEQAQLVEQIERCRRLASLLTDDQMRQALEELADNYEARLRTKQAKVEHFMLRNRI